MARLSLGWQVAMWIEENLLVPEGRRAGKFIRLSGRQLAAINKGYEYDIPDEVIAMRAPKKASAEERELVDQERRDRIQDTAQRVVKHLQVMEAKGSGKSPLLAGIAIAETYGPVIPFDVDEHGFLHGRRNPDGFAAIGANSEEQVKGTTWRAARAMLRKGEAESPIVEEFSIDVGKTRIVDPTDTNKIQYCSASGESSEGWTISFFGIEESAKARRGNGGIEFIDTMFGNVVKKQFAWMMEVTNAPILGLGSFAERTYYQFLEKVPGVWVIDPRGEEIKGSIKDEANKELVLAALRACYGEEACRPAPDGWVNVESVYRSMLKFPEERARRLFLNEVRRSTETVSDPERWRAWHDPGLKIPDGARVALGFDGSVSRDSTVLWAVDIDTMHGQVVGQWAKPLDMDKANYVIPREEVDAAMDASFARWHVVGIGADRAAGWSEQIDNWITKWGSVEFNKLGKRAERGRVLAFFWNNKPSAVHLIVEWFETLMDVDIATPPFTHDGNEVITDHVNNMLLVTNEKTGVKRVDKSSDSIYGQIDGGIAVMLALYVAMKVRKNRPPKTGTGLSTFDKLMGNEPPELDDDEDDEAGAGGGEAEGKPAKKKKQQSAAEIAASLGEISF